MALVSGMGHYRYKARLRYVGLRYQGWICPWSGKSIKDALEQALKRLDPQAPCNCQAASRTDAGTHAVGQLVAFTLSAPLPPSCIVHSLQNMLPHDLAIDAVTPVPLHFIPALANRGKCYTYQWMLCPIPLQSLSFVAPLTTWPAVARMHTACQHLTQWRSFTSVTNHKKGTAQDASIAPLHATLLTNASTITLTLQAPRFTYRMARNLAGLVMAVGQNVVTLETLQKLAHQPRHANPAPTAPACGLTLQEVFL